MRPDMRVNDRSVPSSFPRRMNPLGANSATNIPRCPKANLYFWRAKIQAGPAVVTKMPDECPGILVSINNHRTDTMTSISSSRNIVHVSRSPRPFRHGSDRSERSTPARFCAFVIEGMLVGPGCGVRPSVPRSQLPICARSLRSRHARPSSTERARRS